MTIEPIDLVAGAREDAGAEPVVRVIRARRDRHRRTRGMNGCAGDAWDGLRFGWREPSTWCRTLADWLAPRLRNGGIECLRPGVERDICWDDEAWTDLFASLLPADLDGLLDDLARCLGGATMRTYHGTRTEDAGTFFEAGLRVTTARA